ncbi:MAG: hypothetical protein QXY99_02020 [Thermoproteota archaeon]
MNIIELVTGNLFPREFAIRSSLGGVRRFVVSSPEEILSYTRQWNYVGDIYFGVHALYDLMDGVIRRIYFDFDSEHDVNLAKEDALKVYNFFSSKKILVFSGNKGYHVHVFFSPTKLSNPSSTLREYVRRLAAKLDLRTLDFEPCYNLRGLARLPGTYNIKGKKFCQIIDFSEGGGGENVGLELADIDKSMNEILKDREGRMYNEDGRSESYDMVSDVIVRARLEFRSEVAKLAEKAQHMDLSHEERLILLFEALNANWRNEDIVELFRRQSDFDPKITLYMINHARQRGYKPYSRQKLREVLGEVC